MTDESRPPISPGETEVLKALWQIEKGSVGEIFAAVSPELKMDYTTVQTYVRRLEAKGYITSKRVGRNKRYCSAVRRSQVLGEAINDFVERLFDGDFLPMVKHLVDNREISQAEIDDLMQIVKELQETRGERDAR